MMGFWLLVALLLLAALCFVWWPVLMRRRRRATILSRQELNVQAYETQVGELQADLASGRIDDQQFATLKVELERNLLGDVSLVAGQDSATQSLNDSRQSSSLVAVMLSVLLVVGAMWLYLQEGSSATLQQMAAQQTLAQKLSELPPDERQALLEQESEDNPDQPDIWYALANIYFQQGQIEKTRHAYDQLLALVGEDPVLLAEYAQVEFFLNGNKISASVVSIAERALAVDPQNLSALGLMGISAFEKGDYAKAIAAWQTALSVAPDAQGSEALQMGIERARALMAEQPQATNKPQLTVNVSLDEKLAAQVQPDQVVFVLARAIKGPKMPLAAHRIRVKDLPVTVTLNDEMAMSPELKLSTVDQVEVLARVSLSGQPVAQSGDLQGSFRPVNVSSQQAPIKLVIDQIIE